MASGPITSWQTEKDKVEAVADFVSLGSKITADGDCRHEIKRRLLLGRKVMANLDSILKSRDIPLLTKICLVKAMVFPVVMYGCKNWTLKKADAFQTMVLEKTLESPLDIKEIKPVNPQPWIFIGRTDAEAKTPILWLSDLKNGLIGKNPDAGKGWVQEEMEVSEDEMVGWHHWLMDMNLSKLWKMVKDREACCAALHGTAELDMTKRLSIGEGNGSPLQCSCLEDPTDRGTWRVVVHRVTKSWTQLKRLRTHASTDSLQWKAKILLCFPSIFQTPLRF